MSNAVSIACPNCERKLKITDLKLLGKKVKCPGCQQSFVLAVAGQAETPKSPPVSGKAAASKPAADSNSPLTTPIGPAAAADNSARTESANPFDFAAVESAPSGTSELNRLRQRRKRGKWLNVALIGGFFIVGLGLAGWLVMQSMGRSSTVAKSTSPDSIPTTPSPASDPDLPLTKALLESDPSLIAKFDPTDGNPIDLKMMPSGVNLLIHLRPSLLWSDEYDYQVLRASLTDEVTNWMQTTLEKVCRRSPEKIDEATIGIILGAFGTEPRVCAVVRLKEPERMSQLIEEFGNSYLYNLAEKPGLRLRVDDEYGYLIKNEQTYAICPRELAAELEHWVDEPNFEISEGMEQMLQGSDRERLFTVMGNVADARRHLDSLVPQSGRIAVSAVLDWIGDDVETASWSVHPQPYLYSRVMLRGTTVKTGRELEKSFETKLAEVAMTMWKDVAEKMSPREVRSRQFIGRFPAMLEATTESTVFEIGPRETVLTTVLPSKAAPNLALAAMFTTNEANRTDFSEPRVVASSSVQPKLPDTVEERLRVPVDTEFNRTPLEQALRYLAGEIDVTLNLDGEALEDAAYTRNMPQTFKLGVVPVEQSLAAILGQYQERNREMVIVLDEPSKTLIVTTKKFAERNGQTIRPLNF